MSTSGRPAIQDLYPDDFAHCFGCGRNNPAGHQLKGFVEGDEVVADYTPAPHHVAVPGFVYGGLLASLVDCHAMATAAGAAERAAGRRIGEGEPNYLCAGLYAFFTYSRPYLQQLAAFVLSGRPLGEFRLVQSEAPAVQAGHNDPCPCGSGKKYKRCCLSRTR